MKIEKITENKIRIIVKKEDFKDKTIDLQDFILNSHESQNLFLEILDRAEKEVNFDTDGHKLLIETYFQGKDICIFTITKYLETKGKTKNKSKKYLTLKKKLQTFDSPSRVYKFNEFEDFCEFCDSINKNNSIKLKNIFKTSVLYNYNNVYYLVIDGITSSDSSLGLFFASLLEFSTFLKCNKNFKFKLREHAKIVIKNNAIQTGIKYFTYKK